MKNIFFVIFIFININLFSQHIKAKIQVCGLTCSMCNLATLKSLQSIDFIENVETDLNDLIFIVNFKNDKKINLNEIPKKIKDAGFSVSSFELTTIFPKTIVYKEVKVNLNNDNFQFIGDYSGGIEGEVSLKIIEKDFLDKKQFSNFKKKTNWDTDSNLFHVIFVK